MEISTWVKNVARLSYQYALNVFPIVMRIAEYLFPAEKPEWNT